MNILNTCLQKGKCEPRSHWIHTPNKIPQTTVVDFGALIDTWNISIYIHFMDKNARAPHLWNKSPKMVCVCVCVCVCVLSCSFLGKQEASLPTQVRTKKCHAYFIHLLPISNIKSTTHTLSQNNSQEIIGIIKQHFPTTSHLMYVANGIHDFVKWCIKSWMHLDLRPDNMLFSGLQPTDINWEIAPESNSLQFVPYNVTHFDVMKESKLTWVCLHH